MEEAGKARRNYDEKYEPAKRREKQLHETVGLTFYIPVYFIFTDGLLVQPTLRRIKFPEGSTEII